LWKAPTDGDATRFGALSDIAKLHHSQAKA
jgi:hypothetical protein